MACTIEFVFVVLRKRPRTVTQMDPFMDTVKKKKVRMRCSGLLSRGGTPGHH